MGIVGIDETDLLVGLHLVQDQIHHSAATFAAEQAASAAAGEQTTSVPGVGDAAYSLSISGGGFTTNTFAVRKGTNEVQVNGPGTPAQVQAYATHLLGLL